MFEAGLQPIPGHRLIQRLGAGSFGEVWDAHGPDGKLVALKFLDCRAVAPSVIGSEIRVLRGLSELRHPYFIQVHGIYATPQHVVLSMERAEGNFEDLRLVYHEETGRNIPIDHLLDLLGQAAEGLDFLAQRKGEDDTPASRGWQHCDIKPSNLLLLGDSVKIADLGLCAGTGWRTNRNGWLGTPPYAAPELFKGQAAVGTDQFALCITFLRLCTGDRPFWKSQPLDAPPAGLPIDLTKLRERELPIIARALHPHAEARWPSCREFIEALRDISHSCRPPLNLRPRGLRPKLQAIGHR